MAKSNQTEANKKWYDKNKEHAKYLNKRSHTRSFIKNFATQDDLEELKELIKEREGNLKFQRE
ncbi:hypothetical protein G4W71_06550 [Clostridium botulinum]|uniref:hypothetical protein n=1 Tax=Clostridium botulinum TaxID=1491 RepID=UPI001788D9E2|nr:hypothetical protein [Clostridium botulinum]MBE1303688.1 hypothetical protein [Clostridium botulinum]